MALALKMALSFKVALSLKVGLSLKAQELVEAAKGREEAEVDEPDTSPEEGAALLGAGWHGGGLLSEVGQGPKRRRGLHDSTGISSPGRWPIRKRRLPRSCSGHLRDSIRRFVEDKGTEAVFARLACGKCEGSPFAPAEIDKLREEMPSSLEEAGFDGRTSDEKRTKWRLESQEDPARHLWSELVVGVTNADNRSAHGLEVAVERQLEASVTRGRALVMEECEASKRKNHSVFLFTLEEPPCLTLEETPC